MGGHGAQDRALGRETSLPRELTRQLFMDETYRHRSFADGRGDRLDRAAFPEPCGAPAGAVVAERLDFIVTKPSGG